MEDSDSLSSSSSAASSSSSSSASASSQPSPPTTSSYVTSYGSYVSENFQNFSEFKNPYIDENSTFSDYPEYMIFFHFKEFYAPIHGYLALFVCLFGLVANVLNIIVLTRKNMVSPTNAILTGLAVADMLVMLDYMPFSIHNYIRQGQPVSELFSYPWTVFTLFHAHFSVVFHSISTWLTILLAIWRLLSVSYPTQSKTWFTMRSAIISIISIYLIVPIFCVPMYLSFTISPVEDEGRLPYYRIDWSEISLRHNKFLKNLNFWVFSVGTKLVPCILLTYFSLAIIKILIEADKRKARLRSSNNNKMNNINCNSKPNLLTTTTNTNTTTTTTTTTINNNCENSNDNRRWSCSPTCDPGSTINEQSQNRIELCLSKRNNSPGNQKSCQQLDANNHHHHHQQSNQQNPNHHQHHHHESSQAHDRTTRLLLAVLLIFLLTELPGGILIVLSVFLGENFFQTVYSPLGDLLDILALINSAINFILYCTMSRQFRITFRKIFCQLGDETTDELITSRHNLILNKSTNHLIHKNGKSEVTFV